MKKITIITVIIIITIMILPVGFAYGQQTRTITISPPKLSLTVAPGEIAQGTLSLLNQSDTDVEFMIGLQDFIVVDKKSTPQLVDSQLLNNQFSASHWIYIQPTLGIVPAGERKTFDYVVEVPLDARPGGHYAAIIYTPLPQTVSEKSAALVTTQIATLVSIEVSGKIQESAKITKMLTNLFAEYGPVNITTEIQNNGDLHISPTVQITLIDIFGRKISQIPLPRANIFPGGVTREYTTAIGSKWMIGRFEARLLGSYGKNNNLPLNASVIFWIFPWRLSIVVILVVIALILGIAYWRNKAKEI